MKVVILAGGRGSRLWPLSRHQFPKQFLRFGEEHSLLQKTLLRYSKTASHILVVTSPSYRYLVESQCKGLGMEGLYSIATEPEAKSTAPAVALALRFLEENLNLREDDPVLISSSDALFSPDNALMEAISFGVPSALLGYFLVFGIKPSYPETGYGYIALGEEKSPFLYEVDQFIEKPIKERAEEYIRQGHLWNSGLFLFTPSTFWRELASKSPDLYCLASQSLDKMRSSFAEFPIISFDHAVLEKSERIRVVALQAAWSDVGSWDSVYDIMGKDAHRNVKVGNIVDIDTKDSLILGGKRLISTVGLEGMLIVETEDALYLGKKGESQKVKQVVEELERRSMQEAQEHLSRHFAWGMYTLLAKTKDYRVHKVAIEPLQTASLPKANHWTVVQGVMKVLQGERKEEVLVGEVILENPGPGVLELIGIEAGI